MGVVIANPSETHGRAYVGPQTYDQLLMEARATYVSVIRSSRDVIRHKFALGGLVKLALQWQENNDQAVVQLARDLSAGAGKVVLPQRLYEAARLYDAFDGDLERVWAFEARTSQPLTYTYLIRQIIPRVTKEDAWNPREWERYQEAQLGCLERAVQQIEELAASQPDPAETHSEPGLASIRPSGELTVEPSVTGLLTVCDESPAYQQFSAQVHVSQLYRAATALDRSRVTLTAEDRAILAQTVDLLRRILNASGSVVV